MKSCRKCHFCPCKCKDLAEGFAYDGVEKCRANNPKESLALKVHRKQVPAAIARAKLMGVPTSYTKDGRPIITSRHHQKQLLKLDGFFNQDASYGD